MKMEWKKIEAGICVLLAIFLLSLTINPIFSFSSSQKENAVKERIEIGDTDVSAEFTRKLEIFTNEEYLFKMNFKNSGENDLRYLSSLKLTGPEEVQISAWRESFVIKPGDDYEYMFILKGLEPGRYTLNLTIEEDFFCSTELIEDVLRLGVLGFLPRVGGIVPLLPGMLPFIVEMILYLLSDLWTPIIERIFLVLGGLDVVIAEIFNALARDWDVLAIAITDLLGEILVDLPRSLVEWVRFTPELVESFEPILLEAPIYMIDHLGHLLLEGYSPMIRYFPLLIDGLLAFFAMLRYFGPFAAAALFELIPGLISESGNMTLFKFLLVGGGFLGLGGGLWLLLAPWGLLTPIYILYHLIYPLLDKIFYVIHKILSPILGTLAKFVSKFSELTLGNLYEWFAPWIIRPVWYIFNPIIRFVIDIICRLLDAFSILFKIWEVPVGWLLSIQTPRIVSYLSKPAAPIFGAASKALWHIGSFFMPQDYGAMKGEAHVSIEVEVRDLTFFERAMMKLEDIWDTTVGTIGEYWG